VLTEYDARQQTEDEKRELRRKQNDLIKEIVAHDGTMKDLVNQLAQSYEKSIELLDCNFAINQISTEITRTLKSLGCSVASCVYQYLPPKYKNPHTKRVHEILDHMNLIVDHTVPLHDSIEHSSNSEIENSVQFVEKAKHLSDDVGTLLNNVKENLFREGLRRGMKELAGEKIRDQISERDYRYEIPDYFGLEELNQEVINQGNRWANALIKFFNVKYKERPGHIRQDVYQWANSIRVMANVTETLNENKWSGDMTFWFDREYWATIQSKHDAGNSTMFPTTLCANCSKDVENDPKDCVRMKYWRPSPTHYICEQCGGTKILGRENTREQVGDKQADVYRDASDVLNHIPFYADVFVKYVERVKSPPIYSRKAAIRGEFSKSSIAGTDKLVIPRKK
jgi:hypothetical protein